MYADYREVRGEFFALISSSLPIPHTDSVGLLTRPSTDTGALEIEGGGTAFGKNQLP